MRVVVTGGAGFIGSHVAEGLLTAGHEVIVVDNLTTGKRDNLPEKVQLIVGDIMAPQSWVEEIKQADVMIHLAAQVSVPISEENPDYDLTLNGLGTIRVFQAGQQLGVKEFRMTSSAAVYGDNSQMPLHETAHLQPISFYGLSKWTAERYALALSEKSQIPTLIFRPANVYGPRQQSDGEGAVVASFCQMLKEGRGPVIHGDGRQTRDFISVRDIARAFVHRIGESRERAIYNLSRNENTSVLALWTELEKIAGVDVKPRFGPQRQGDIRTSILDNQKALNWGWTPSIPLREGLEMAWDYYKG